MRPLIKEIMTRDYSYYLDSCNMARLSDYSTRCGAVAAVGKKRIAGSWNSFRSIPANTLHGHATFHAEHNCLAGISERFLPKVTLYIARLGKDGMPLASRPCKRCLTELYEKRVPEVVYMNQEGLIVKEIL